MQVRSWILANKPLSVETSQLAMQSRKSCDFEGHALIWQSEDSTSKQKAAEYSERRIGFFEAQLRAARQRRAERLQKREEARQARRARLQAEALHTNHHSCSVMVREDAPVYMQRQFIHSGYLIGITIHKMKHHSSEYV